MGVRPPQYLTPDFQARSGFSALEAETGKPVVNSNQATIWAACKLLGQKLGPQALSPLLGSLIER